MSHLCCPYTVKFLFHPKQLLSLSHEGVVLRSHRSPIITFPLGLILVLVKTPLSFSYCSQIGLPSFQKVNTHWPFGGLPVLRFIRCISLILSPVQTLVTCGSYGAWWFVPNHLYFGVCEGILSPSSVVNIVHRFGVLLSSLSLCFYARI